MLSRRIRLIGPGPNCDGSEQTFLGSRNGPSEPLHFDLLTKIVSWGPLEGTGTEEGVDGLLDKGELPPCSLK